MNDDVMSQLDDRGRAAAAGLQAAVAVRPVPDFDPDLIRVSLHDDPAGDPDRRGRRWVAVVGVAAALLVVALGAAVASRTGDDDSAPAEQVDTTEPIRPYAAGWLPDGFEVTNVSGGVEEGRGPSPRRSA